MTGSLQIKSEKYYAVLNFKDSSGQRVQKWIPLNLSIKDNKRRAEAMLNALVVQYQGWARMSKWRSACRNSWGICCRRI